MKAACCQPCRAKIAAAASAITSVVRPVVCRPTLTCRASSSTIGRVGNARTSSMMKCRYGVCAPERSHVSKATLDDHSRVPDAMMHPKMHIAASGMHPCIVSYDKLGVNLRIEEVEVLVRCCTRPKPTPWMKKMGALSGMPLPRSAERIGDDFHNCVPQPHSALAVFPTIDYSRLAHLRALRTAALQCWVFDNISRILCVAQPLSAHYKCPRWCSTSQPTCMLNLAAT